MYNVCAVEIGDFFLFFFFFDFYFVFVFFGEEMTYSSSCRAESFSSKSSISSSNSPITDQSVA